MKKVNQYLIYLMFLLLPIYHIKVGIVTINEMILFISLIVTLVLVSVRAELILGSWTRILVIYVCFIISNVVSGMISSNPDISFKFIMPLLMPLIMLIIMSQNIHRKIQFEAIAKIIVYSGLVLSLFTFFQIITDWNLYYGSSLVSGISYRTTGTFSNPNLLGVFLIPSLIFSFHLSVSMKKKYFILHFITIFMALVLSGSLGAIVSSTIGIVVSYCFNMYKYSKKNTVNFIMTLVFIICSLALLISYQKFFSYLQQDSGFLSRLFLWNDAFKFLNEGNYLFGIGQGMYYIQSHLGYLTHNVYLQLVIENGIVGLLFYITLFLFLIINLFLLIIKKIENNFITLSLLGSLIAFLIQGTVMNTLNNWIIWFIFCLATLWIDFIKKELNINEKKDFNISR